MTVWFSEDKDVEKHRLIDVEMRILPGGLSPAPSMMGKRACVTWPSKPLSSFAESGLRQVAMNSLKLSTTSASLTISIWVS